MTRYSIKVGEQWVAATYDSGPGVLLTNHAEDACSWVTLDRTCAAARQVSEFFKRPTEVCVTEEVDYPRCWGLQNQEVASCR